MVLHHFEGRTTKSGVECAQADRIEIGLERHPQRKFGIAEAAERSIIGDQLVEQNIPLVRFAVHDGSIRAAHQIESALAQSAAERGVLGTDKTNKRFVFSGLYACIHHHRHDEAIN